MTDLRCEHGLAKPKEGQRYFHYHIEAGAEGEFMEQMGIDICSSGPQTSPWLRINQDLFANSNYWAQIQRVWFNMSKIITRNPCFLPASQINAPQVNFNFRHYQPSGRASGLALSEAHLWNPLLLFPALREKMTHLLLDGGGGLERPVTSICTWLPFSVSIRPFKPIAIIQRWDL